MKRFNKILHGDIPELDSQLSEGDIDNSEHGDFMIDGHLQELAHNYIGTQVKAELAGRTFLGDVVNARPIEGDFMLEVRHFNGEPWPFDPRASRVDFLDRE